MSEEFREHVKEVLAPLETTLVDSATRLEEHLKASMEQHEMVVKGSHDCIVEASEKYKDALTKQVREMEKYIDWYEVQKEATAAAANSARMRLRDVSMGVPKELEPTNQGWKNRKIWAETVLATLDKDQESARKGWSEERIVFQEKIKCREDEIEKLKAERDKYEDLVSAHATRSFQRSQEQVGEKAIAAKLAGDYAELRRIAEHNEGQLKDARKERDAAVLENQDLKRKREASNSPPPSPLRILSRPPAVAPVQNTPLSPTPSCKTARSEEV
jgi:hypothetical protein